MKENKPSALDTQIGGTHYKNMKIQPLEFILANELGYAEGAVIKYVCRWKNKNGIEDLKKARHYLDVMIENEEKK
jgi:hypothetical protein